MSNCFSKTFGCITITDYDELVKSNQYILKKHNLLKETMQVEERFSKKHFREVCRIMLLREVLYLVYGFKPNKVFIINC